MSQNKNVEDIYPLAPSQHGMLLYLLLENPGPEVYFEQYWLGIDGELDAAAWRSAWQGIVDRHPALRTQFLWERRENPLQVVRREVELPWVEHDWRDLPEEEQEARIASLGSSDIARGFDLRQAPLTRCALVRLKDDHYRFLWSFSHLVADGWSIALVLGEALSRYAAARRGESLELPPTLPYGDYVSWALGQDNAEAEAIWRRTLAGFDAPTPLPYDGTGESLEAGEPQSAKWEMRLDAALFDQLEEIARSGRVTVSSLFQGAWALLLSRMAGQDDVMFGAVGAGRPTELPGIDQTVGLFINGLPVRARLERSQGFLEWLADLQSTQSEVRRFEHCPAEEIRAWSDMPHGGALFESVLIYENYPVDTTVGAMDPGIRISPVAVHEAGNIPLTIFVSPHQENPTVRLLFHRDRMAADAAEELGERFVTVLRSIAESPQATLDEIAVLGSDEAAASLAAGRGAEVERPPVLLHQLFEEQVARRGEAIALVAGERELSYAELDARAASLAAELRGHGVGPDVIVGLAVERSPEMILGMLGVLKAGGAYLPLDPEYPSDRLSFMLEDSGARVLLTDRASAEVVDRGNLPQITVDSEAELGEGVDLPPASTDAANLAYVIYTSGSTGTPKGVGVPHSSICHYTADSVAAYEVTENDRALQFASMSFDTSGEEIYPALTTGATLVLRDADLPALATDFVARIGEQGITVLNLPTAFWHEIAFGLGASEGHAQLPESLRLVIIGGEEALADRLQTWHRFASGTPRLMNTYGPTEATIVSTRADLSQPAAGPVPIGTPLTNARGHVLDRSLQPVPDFVAGELHLGGLGLARGYLGRPAQTAAAFVPDPHSETPGARLYRSGDLARRLPGGALEFRGRADDQVKVRGYRIELGEVEAALRETAGVRDAVAVVRGEQAGEGRLVAYWVSEEEGAVDKATLRDALEARLPQYMVPGQMMELPSLPMTPAGKVDRRSLPAPGPDREGEGSYEAPTSPTEEVLVGIWGELLGVDPVGIHDDFFELGGHSLLVARMAARVRQALSFELPMTAVFDHPTIAGLAGVIEDGESEASMPELPPVVPVDRDGIKVPLSFPQERVWFLDRLYGGGNRAYNFQVTIWIDGPMHMEAFHRSLTELVRRHEILRTSFPDVDGEPVQKVHPPEPAWMPYIDLSALSESDQSDASEALVVCATDLPFDIAVAPLIRWWMVRLAPERHELIQTEQHFVHDGWSFGVVLRELKAIYSAYLAGEESPLEELPIQYGDYALWQRTWMEGEAMGQMLDYWTQQIEGAPTALQLPTDHPRPERPVFKGDMDLHQIPNDVYQGLRAFARREGFTLFMTALSAFYVFLYRYSGQEDILVGTTNANRRSKELEGLIGMLVNSLVLRGRLDGEPTFRELLHRVRDMTLGAWSHQDMPLERLVQAADPKRHPGRNPLFQCLFQFHDASIPDLEWSGLKAAYLVRGNRTAKMDLTAIIIPRAEQRIGMDETEDEMKAMLHWEYSTDLFDKATADRMATHFINLLRNLVVDPDLKISELRMLTDTELHQLRQWNEQTARKLPTWNSPAECVAAHAAERGSATAVEMGDQSWTYAELADESHRLAHHLVELGVGPEVLVAVALERSPRMLATLLAVQEAGGAYLPLDPAFPTERLSFMLRDSGASLLITEDALAGRLPPVACPLLSLDRDASAIAARPAEAIVGRAVGENLAYVLYTSGSTGVPKGVAVQRSALANFLASMAIEPGFGRDDSLLAVTTLSFDISGLELYLPLVAGGKVVLADAETASSGSALAAEIGRVAPSHVQATPATWRLLLDADFKPAEGLRILTGGEALPPSLAKELTTSGASVWNVYGPTETTIWSTLDPIEAGSEDVSIGRPIANTRTYVSSRRWELAPVGVHGQLLIGGEGLARGYLGQPALTAERFVPDPYSRQPGARLYATGDLVKRREDGRLNYLGRIDHQVKVRGFRIELGEVEATLEGAPGVARAVVAAKDDLSGVARLVGYIVAADGAEPGAEELAAHVAGRLPSYMVPSAWVMLDEVPMTANNKVDRNALPDPEGSRKVATEDYVAPRNQTEELITELWSEVLGVEKVGVRDSFFVLGGHSLAAGRVLARLRDRTGIELPLSVVFDTPTVEGMASAVVEARRLESAEDLSDSELDDLLGEMLAEGGQS